MNASELIDELQKLVELHGDAEVVMANQYWDFTPSQITGGELIIDKVTAHDARGEYPPRVFRLEFPNE